MCVIAVINLTLVFLSMLFSKKNDGKVMINTDCHNKEKLDCYISESRALLKDVGFSYVYVFYDNEFRKDYL